MQFRPYSQYPLCFPILSSSYNLLISDLSQKENGFLPQNVGVVTLKCQPQRNIDEVSAECNWVYEL